MIDTYLELDRLLSFVSVHHSMKAEKLLAEANIQVAAIPTPREVDISCGQCVLFTAQDEQKVLAILSDNRVRWSKLFRRDYGTKSYEKLAELGG